MTDTITPALEQSLEQHRAELTRYCYRMLGSPFEAEDAVQDAFVRAWRAHDRFEGRSALRSWLYRIATNVCLDMISGRERRARPIEIGPAWDPGGPIGRILPETTWIEPTPTAASAGGAPTPPTSPSRARRSGWRSSPRSSTCPRASAPC